MTMESISSAPVGTVVRVQGDISSIVVRPESALQAMEAELVDDSGKLLVVWLGRHSIHGILPGRRLTVEGRIVLNDDQRMMYNPRYELHPRGTDER